MSRLIVLSNRVTIPDGKGCAGGLAVAMQEALQSKGGIWCGWSGQIREFPKRHTEQHGNITYATVDFTKPDHDDFYLGYCNSTLWPLFHYRMGLTHYRQTMQDAYERVNEMFAGHVAQMSEPGDTIWVQDYQMMRVGHYLREKNVRNRLGFFLHIPFPTPEVLGALPNARDILEGLSAFDTVGFQTWGDLQSFLRCISDFAGGRAVYDARENHCTVEAFGRTFIAAAFPISIDTANLMSIAADSESTSHIAQLKRSLNGRKMVIGVDRLDYSKGIPNRLEAYDYFLRENADRAEDYSYMQITPTSRSDVNEYIKLREQVEGLVTRINGEHARMGWVPVQYINRSYSREMLAGYYRQARACLVTPLRDGMNLVAKEYVACQNPADPGVLVLSQFAGAAQELDCGAIIVNPFDTEAMGEAIRLALSMPLEERRDRHQRMIRVLKGSDIFGWTESFLRKLGESDHAPSMGVIPLTRRSVIDAVTTGHLHAAI